MQTAQTVIEFAAVPTLLLNVGAKEYTVSFPMSAVVRAEEAIGKELKGLHDWFNLKSADIPKVLTAGLSKNHPDISEGEIQEMCDRFNPEALDEVLYALCKLSFPKRMAALEADTEKRRDTKISDAEPV